MTHKSLALKLQPLQTRLVNFSVTQQTHHKKCQKLTLISDNMAIVLQQESKSSLVDQPQQYTISKKRIRLDADLSNSLPTQQQQPVKRFKTNNNKSHDSDIPNLPLIRIGNDVIKSIILPFLSIFVLA